MNFTKLVYFSALVSLSAFAQNTANESAKITDCHIGVAFANSVKSNHVKKIAKEFLEDKGYTVNFLSFYEVFGEVHTTGKMQSKIALFYPGCSRVSNESQYHECQLRMGIEAPITLANGTLARDPNHWRTESTHSIKAWGGPVNDKPDFDEFKSEDLVRGLVSKIAKCVP